MGGGGECWRWNGKERKPAACADNAMQISMWNISEKNTENPNQAVNDCNFDFENLHKLKVVFLLKPNVI